MVNSFPTKSVPYAPISMNAAYELIVRSCR